MNIFFPTATWMPRGPEMIVPSPLACATSFLDMLPTLAYSTALGTSKYCSRWISSREGKEGGTHNCYGSNFEMDR